MTSTRTAGGDPIRSVPRILLCAAILWTWGCGERRADVFPENAGPGYVVQARVTSDRFRDGQDLRVRIDDQPAPLVGVVDARTVEALVPFLPAGLATLAIYDGNRLVAQGELTILPPSSRRVVLSIKGDKVGLVRVTPAADPPTRNPRRRDVRRISYDLLNAHGGLVVVGSVLHPSEGGELLHDPAEGRLHRTSALDSTTIEVVIPYMADPQMLVVYDTSPGIDLADPNHRARRKRLASFTLPAGANP